MKNSIIGGIGAVTNMSHALELDVIHFLPSFVPSTKVTENEKAGAKIWSIPLKKFNMPLMKKIPEHSFGNVFFSFYLLELLKPIV